MVKISTKENKELYQCEECGFHYADDSTSLITGKEQAEKCEAWCREHNSCNLEITAQAEENFDAIRERSKTIAPQSYQQSPPANHPRVY